MESRYNIAQLHLLQNYPLCMAQQYHLLELTLSYGEDRVEITISLDP